MTLQRLVTLLALLSGAVSAHGEERSAEVFIPGHAFHGIHGITFDSEDRLYVGSVIGQSIYRVDSETGASEVWAGPPQGMADDLEFAPDGALVWTSFIVGKVHTRKGDGEIRELASGLPGINSLAFKQDGRLFATQVFLGDALYEIDLKGEKPPRKIIENMGGLNGFDFGPDGYLYGPLWFKGQVARVDVDTGELTVIADGFKVPAAANFDSKGNLYVLDSGRGHVVRVDVKTGEKTLVSEFKTAMDNLAFDSKDRLFLTIMAEDAIYEIDTKTGAARTVKEGKLGLPAGLAIWNDGGRETLYVADTFATRAIDPSSGKITDLARTVETEHEYAMSGIDVSAKYLHQTGFFGGTVQTLDRKSGEILMTYHGFVTPYDVLELEDGSLLVAQMAAGNLVHVTGEDEADRAVLIDGLTTPVSMAKAVPGENVSPTSGAIYVVEYAKGEVVRIDLGTGQRQTVARGLDRPEGIAVAADGTIFVTETGTQSVLRLGPEVDDKTVVASGIPMGLPVAPGLPPMGILSGIAVTAAGDIFVSSDLEDAIYRIGHE